MRTTTYRIECGLPFDLSKTRNSPDDPNNRDGIWTHVLTCAARSGLTVLTSILYPFAGGGITGVAILAESSLSLHTWPESNFALVEMTTCGARQPTERFVEAIALSSRSVSHRIAWPDPVSTPGSLSVRMNIEIDEDGR